MKHTQFPSLTLKSILLYKYQYSLSTTNKLRWIYTGSIQFHVPLDKDTYDGKESKYTRLDLKQNHLAISKEEYIDLDQHQLNSCLKLHTDYLCPNLRLTASTHVLSCAAAVFQTTPDDSLIHSICQFTYYEQHYPDVYQPCKPVILQQTRVPNSLPMGVNYVDYKPQGTEVIQACLQITPC